MKTFEGRLGNEPRSGPIRQGQYCISGYEGELVFLDMALEPFLGKKIRLTIEVTEAKDEQR